MLRNHVGWVKRACTAAATLVTGTPSTYFPVKSIERPSKSNQASIVILRVFSEDSCVPKGIANAHIYTKRIEWVGCRNVRQVVPIESRSEEHTSELQSLMRISYAVFCLKKKNHNII